MSGRRGWGWAGALAVALLLLAPAARAAAECPYKVYVILGFHANFYHSWRGDTPDEAGFGQDIRIVREIIRMLDEANAQGLDARGYWEGESLFTFEDIVPKHAPDIIVDLRRRIQAGQDEFMPAPYSNTLFSAVTEDEMRAVVEWSITNPWGSGAKDLFGGYVPLVRPQEAMSTTGQARVLQELGVAGMVLAYSSYSFTAFSNFVAPMPPEQRYHFTTMRMGDEGPALLLFPCVSAADVVNEVSLEKWLLRLRKLQVSGRVNQDLVIHINFDADADTWLPMVPPALDWVPNAGGLPEYIRAVNRYPWAEFTLPSIYLNGHEPVGEVTIRQDTADGGWDGAYSWAEKYPSHLIWTELERSRLLTRRAETLMGIGPSEKCGPGSACRSGDEIDRLLYSGRDSAFFHRVRGLSTTHYGMSTPMVNEERQAVAERVAAAARDRAEQAERRLAERAAGRTAAADGGAYRFMVKGLMDQTGGPVFQVVRVPLIAPLPLPDHELLDETGAAVAFALANVEVIDHGLAAAELLIPLRLGPGEERVFTLRETGRPAPASDRRLDRLDNGRVQLELSTDAGVERFVKDGVAVGGADFLSPFISYRAGRAIKSHGVKSWEIAALAGEQGAGFERARLAASIPWTTPGGAVEAKLTATFTLPASAPWLIADVEVSYPYTAKRDLLHNMTQKLRRYLDLGWVEVAPFQLAPRFEATRSSPLKVWKHNWLGVTSWYELDYGQINPKNAELDAFNHQVTAGWLAVTDQTRGLLLAQSADFINSFAFCPMRLRERDGRQLLRLNPFGSYHGKQMDYSHLGGNGVGSEIADMASSALRPNGPSYNGARERFALLLAPYEGDRPPDELAREAWAFYYPAEVVYLSTPLGPNVRLRQDALRSIEAVRREVARRATGPLPAPLAFLANPTDGAVDLVWDEPEDARIDGYELEWSAEGGDGELVRIEKARRYRLEPVENGTRYVFRLRAVGAPGESEWTAPVSCVAGPVKAAGVLGNVGGIKLSTVAKTIHYINVHLFTRALDRAVIKARSGKRPD